MLRQISGLLKVQAPSPGLFPVTDQVVAWLAEQRVNEGLLILFCRHTSASLLIQESAAPAARRDLERYFARLAPKGAGYEHDDEGPDDMPAHLRSALTQTQLSIPVQQGRMALGTWQAIYLFEHRRVPTMRQIVMHLLGE